jgi:hypothetical protein
MGATTCNVHGRTGTLDSLADPADEHGSCSNSRCHAETSRSSASLPSSIHCFVDTRARRTPPAACPPLPDCRGQRLVDLLSFSLPHKYCQFVIMQVLSFLQDAIVASNLLAY